MFASNVGKIDYMDLVLKQRFNMSVLACAHVDANLCLSVKKGRLK